MKTIRVVAAIIYGNIEAGNLLKRHSIFRWTASMQNSIKDLLKAHKIMMNDLVKEAGPFAGRRERTLCKKGKQPEKAGALLEAFQ